MEYESMSRLLEVDEERHFLRFFDHQGGKVRKVSLPIQFPSCQLVMSIDVQLATVSHKKRRRIGKLSILEIIYPNKIVKFLDDRKTMSTFCEKYSRIWSNIFLDWVSINLRNDCKNSLMFCLFREWKCRL